MDRIEQEQESAAELKRKLGKRLGLAAVLIVVLLGALAMFDHLSTMEREDTAKTDVAPVQPRLGPSISSGRPPEPALPAEEPITPPVTLAPKPILDPVAPAVAPPPKPEIAAQPTVAPPAPLPRPAAVVETKPLPLPAPLAPAVQPKPIASAPSTVVNPPSATKPIAPVAPIAGPSAPAAPVASTAATIPEGTSSAPMLGAATSPAPVRLPAPVSPPAPVRPALSRLIDGFVLQAGVFTSTERAEELKARLVLAGVPVTIETRVQVGPFKSQKEADAARQKIRELGIDSILIPPRSSRR